MNDKQGRISLSDHQNNSGNIAPQQLDQVCHHLLRGSKQHQAEAQRRGPKAKYDHKRRNNVQKVRPSV